MKSKALALLTVSLLVLAAAPVLAADLEVSQPVQVTNSTYYERGQSIVYDGSDYWLIYGRSATEIGWYQAGNPNPDPDTHDYEVYYKKASTVSGLVSATATKISAPGNANSYLGETGATYFGGEIWAFASIDEGAQADVYGWYTTDGTSWTEVTDMLTGLSTGSAHHDEIAFGGELFIMGRRGDDFYTTHSTTPKTGGWSAEVGVGAGGGGLAHFFVDGGTLYLACLKSPAPRENHIHQYNPGGDSWSLVASATSAGWDPTLFKVGSRYVFAQAPWTSEGGAHQYVIQWNASALDANFFNGGSQMAVEGRYGANTWVDMWPIGFTDNGGTSYLFYTSERKDPGQEGTGNIWYVEVDWDVTLDHYTYIQEAVDAATGTTINVAAGTYREQVYIDKTLDLDGAGIGSSIIEAPDPGDRTTYSITQWTGSTKTIDAVIGVHDAGTVNISGFTVDGRDTGPDGFYGVHFYDSDGSVTHCRIEDITFSTSPGSQNVVSVVATHGLGETISVDFSDNEIPNLQKGGIVVMGPGVSFTVDRNNVIDSESDVIASNGIQLSYGASGTTEDNVVQNVGYTGTDWGGTGILLFESGDVSMDGDEVFNCQMGVNFSDWGWIYSHPSVVNLDFSDVYIHDSEWSFGAQLSRDNSDPTITLTGCTIDNSAGDAIDVWGTGLDPWGGSYYTGWDNGDLILTITGCTITNTTGWDGLWTGDLSGNATNSATLNVNYNSFVNHASYAVNHTLPDTMDATNCWWGDPAGPTTAKGGGGKSPAMAMVQPYGFDTPDKGHAFAKPVGDAKTGGSIHGSIDYLPFLTGDIICDPDPQEISLADGGYADDVDVHYLGGSGAVYGYSIEVEWDSTVVTGSFSKPASGPFYTAQFFQVIPIDAGHVRVDCALGGAGAGTLGPDDLFTCTFTAVGTPDYATTTIDLTIVDLRDNANQPLSADADDGEVIVDLVGPSVTLVAIANTTLGHTDDYVKNTDEVTVTATITDGGGMVSTDIEADLTGFGGAADANPTSWADPVATWTIGVPGVTCSPANGTVTVTVTAVDDLGNSSNGNDTIIADNTPPTAITGFDAEPHHQRVALSWDDPSGLDTYYYGVVVRFDSSSVYPVYGTHGSYPASESDGDYDAYNSTGVVTGGNHTVANPRSIYYYMAFAYDWALNYGPADTGARDRATNYWLGDVTGSWTPGSEDYDGKVDAGDVNVLSGVYWTSGLSWSATECDVGPTDDGTRLGIPIVDNQIQFEDMMIFAMNFNVVTPTGMPPVVQLVGRPEAGPPVLRLESTEMAKGMTVSLCLGGNTAEVKGASMVLTYNPEILEMVDVTPTLSDQALFEYREVQAGEVWIDLAALGTDVAIQGSGEIAQITFDVKSDGDMNIRFAEADLRDASNGRLNSSTEGLAFDFRSSTPSVTELAGAWPNPFNPTTAVQYSLRHADHVTLQIYDAQGRLVRTLVSETLNAGRYSTVWNGRDNGGVEVSSGTYFVRMHTSQYESTSKVVMLK